MNMKHDLNYMIAVMQAAKEGKKIELKFRTNKGSWDDIENPLWDWRDFDYRIKPEEPEPKYVPYESAEEFIAAMREHGLMLQHKMHPDCIVEPFVNTDSNVILYLSDGSEIYTSLKRVFECYIWRQDKTTCGKLKE